MIGGVNTNVQNPNNNKEESSLSKFANWANTAMNAGLTINGLVNAVNKGNEIQKLQESIDAMKAPQDAPNAAYGELRAPKPQPFKLEF